MQEGGWGGGPPHCKLSLYRLKPDAHENVAARKALRHEHTHEWDIEGVPKPSQKLAEPAESLLTYFSVHNEENKFTKCHPKPRKW